MSAGQTGVPDFTLIDKGTDEYGYPVGFAASQQCLRFLV